MSGAELKALIPDTAVVYIEGVELMAEDVEVDGDGDFQIMVPEDAAEDESDEGEEDEEDEAE